MTSPDKAFIVVLFLTSILSKMIYDRLAKIYLSNNCTKYNQTVIYKCENVAIVSRLTKLFI